MSHVCNMNLIGLNVQIADITEPDTSKHYCDISAFVPKNCVAIVIKAQRITGTGMFNVYPIEGTTNITIKTGEHGLVALVEGSQRFQYLLSVANDDWDIFLFAAFVEGRIM